MDTAQDSKIENTENTPRLRSIPSDPLCQGILPLTDWVKSQEQSGEENCPPCDLATIAPWYRDLLQKKGYPELAAKIQALSEGEHDTIEVASILDEVKEGVRGNEEVEQELLLYDCMMQKYEEEGG